MKFRKGLDQCCPTAAFSDSRCLGENHHDDYCAVVVVVVVVEFLISANELERFCVWAAMPNEVWSGEWSAAARYGLPAAAKQSTHTQADVTNVQ